MIWVCNMQLLQGSSLQDHFFSFLLLLSLFHRQSNCKHLFNCLSAYACLSLSLTACLSVWQTAHLSVSQIVCFSDCLSLKLFVCLSLCLTVCVSDCLSFWLSACLSVFLSVFLSICLFMMVMNNCEVVSPKSDAPTALFIGFSLPLALAIAQWSCSMICYLNISSTDASLGCYCKVQWENTQSSMLKHEKIP